MKTKIWKFLYYVSIDKSSSFYKHYLLNVQFEEVDNSVH